MKVKLQEIVNVRTGIFAKTVKEGNFVYLQAKHFDEYGLIRSKLHPDLEFDTQIQRHILNPGDVLFAAKGSKNFATVYKEEYPPSIASTSFFVLRINRNFRGRVLPEFLVWCLNHPTAMLLLKGKAIGTSIVSISKSVLEEMELYIPDVRQQKNILEIAELRNREGILKKKIEALREQLIQHQIFSALK